MKNVFSLPGLLDHVQTHSLADIDFFKNLPLHLTACWAVYLLVLHKEGCIPKIYIGSATKGRLGALHRLNNYHNRTNLPVFVDKAFNDGYNIKHAGFLCWADIPPFAHQTPIRALFLILETLFSLLYWPMVSRTKDYFMPKLSPWLLSDFDSYGGLCNHFSINEGIVGINDYVDEDLTAEQIKTLEVLNYNRFRERCNIAARKWLDEGGGKQKMSDARKRLRLDNLELERYFCDDCGVNCGTLGDLTVHKTTPKHKLNAAGIAKVVKKPGDKALAERNVNSRRFVCRPCNYVAQINADLRKHFKSLKHANNTAPSTESSLDAVE